MTFRRYQLCLQTDPVKLVDQPICTLDQVFLVLVVSRDAWKPQERIILLEIIVAHAGSYSKFWGAHAPRVLISAPAPKSLGAATRAPVRPTEIVAASRSAGFKPA